MLGLNQRVLKEVHLTNVAMSARVVYFHSNFFSGVWIIKFLIGHICLISLQNQVLCWQNLFENKLFGCF